MSRVSYLMAAHDHERWVAQAIESVLAQRYHDVEVVVVDDGSSDRTPAIAREFAARDSRCIVIEQERGGVVAARNTAARRATGDFLSLLDSDDFVEPDRTGRLLERISGAPGAVLAYGDAWLTDAQGARTACFSEIYPPASGPFAVRMFRGNCFTPAVSVLFRADALHRTGDFWGAGPTSEYVKWIELGLIGGAVRLEGPPVGNWRIHTSNQSGSDGAQRAANYEGERTALETLYRSSERLRSLVTERQAAARFARCRLIAGAYLAHAGHWDAASRAFAASYAECPSAAAAVGRTIGSKLLRPVLGPLLRSAVNVRLGAHAPRSPRR